MMMTKIIISFSQIQMRMKIWMVFLVRLFTSFFLLVIILFCSSIFLQQFFFQVCPEFTFLRYIHVFTMIMFCFIALSLLRAWEYLTLDFLISFLNKRYCHLITTNIDSQSFFFYSATVQYCNIKFKYFILIINSFMTEADII